MFYQDMPRTFLLISLLLSGTPLTDAAEPKPIKAVVLAMYEIGESAGDIPGELQFWVERYPGVEPIEFPLGRRELYLNDEGVLVALTGGGLTHAATTITALGLDARFDFSKAYWLIAGIAGADPEDASLGTAAWARYVVDGDLMKEIDGREIPESWPYGQIPLGAKEPNTFDGGWSVDNIVFELNAGLAQWAYELTKDDAVDDTPALAEFRTAFKGYPAAQTPPRVILGDGIASSTYWHGALMNDWANDWVKLHTGGKGNFVMTGMEDTGTLTALRRLSLIGNVDMDRVMILRTGSNFSRQPPGKDVAWSTTAPYPDNGLPALEAAYKLGSKVVNAIVDDWSVYATELPFAKPVDVTPGCIDDFPANGPIKIKAVVVTMFEIGEDTGDRPAEFQYWVERWPLTESIAFPHGYRNLRYDPETGVLGIVTGIGTFRSASSIMALGMDPRFDLSQAYWLVAGIAGVDPNDMSLGSAAWAEWLIDGDLAHHIDAREAPAEWTTGYTPLRHTEPYKQPLPENDEGVRYKLDSALVEWAYQLSKDTELLDNEGSAKLRARYVNYPTAQRPPFVLKGDQLAAMTFWHGKLNNDWANDWVNYWTEGSGNFVTSAMEETGTMQSLTFLDNAGKVDIDRVLVLRTASNFSMQYEGVTAVESLSGEKKGGYSAFIPAVDNAYRVGSVVLRNIIEGWETHKNTLPGQR
tara:strand:+ start:37592 stop:39679 length:2088 start_codon:yes stop_codon:yes gene_type:complete